MPVPLERPVTSSSMDTCSVRIARVLTGCRRLGIMKVHQFTEGNRPQLSNKETPLTPSRPGLISSSVSGGGPP